MMSGRNIAQKRKRTYRKKKFLHVVQKIKKQLAHGEGRTRSLQIYPRKLRV